MFWWDLVVVGGFRGAGGSHFHSKWELSAIERSINGHGGTTYRTQHSLPRVLHLLMKRRLV